VQTNLEKLKSAFGEAFPLASAAHCDEIEYGRTEGWDSVAHMALIAQIEGTFDVMLDSNEVVELSSFSKAKEILGRYGVTFE
jgi:acyl carrier protein